MGLPSAQPVRRDVAQFAATALDQRAVGSLTCDVSFISDDSTPPEAIVARQIEQLRDPRASALIWSIFDCLRAQYDAGSIVPHPAGIAMLIRQTMTGEFGVDERQFQALASFFERVNSVMFQHQTLAWLAESQFKVHIYGTGWDASTFFSRFARGPIESDTTRLAIYRASRINLAANVYGAVDNRVIEGITAGGFYLMRYCPADVIERIFPPLSEFCSAHAITTNAQLAERATPAVRSLLAFASRTIDADVLTAWPDFVSRLRSAADAGYTHSAAALWPQYPAVAFSCRDELIGLVGRYLYDQPLRQRVADEMRKQLVTRFEHVRVNRRLMSAAPRSEVAA